MTVFGSLREFLFATNYTNNTNEENAFICCLTGIYPLVALPLARIAVFTHSAFKIRFHIVLSRAVSSLSHVVIAAVNY